jgi:hypothetical protein
MAQIDFYVDNFHLLNTGGSGIGFYGSSFGSSVGVGNYQNTTFITDSNGAIQGEQINNIQWTHPNSGSINGAASVELTKIPNYLSTLNLRFSHSTAVNAQNAKLRIYDRSNINNNPSGVTCKVAEIVHPDTVQNNNGSGDTTWLTPRGSAIIVDMAQSPGLSGMYAGGGSAGVLGTQHDWYAAIAVSPDSVGSKLFALYFELEYL